MFLALLYHFDILKKIFLQKTKVVRLFAKALPIVIYIDTILDDLVLVDRNGLNSMTLSNKTRTKCVISKERTDTTKIPRTRWVFVVVDALKVKFLRFCHVFFAYKRDIAYMFRSRIEGWMGGTDNLLKIV